METTINTQFSECIQKLKMIQKAINFIRLLNICYAISAKPEPMFLCCNPECGPSWFDASCVGADTPGVCEDFYCCPECEKSSSYIYCACQTKDPANLSMIQCSRGPECFRYEWYHLSCIRKDPDADFEGM